MPLNTGTRVGVYEVSAAIGAGGMGEVYRARDNQLNRDVAIKVLPELFALDVERLARFTREAQTLAALTKTRVSARASRLCAMRASSTPTQAPTPTTPSTGRSSSAAYVTGRRISDSSSSPARPASSSRGQFLRRRKW